MSVGKVPSSSESIRAITRGSSSHRCESVRRTVCRQAPVDATTAQRDGKTERQSPIRWLSLR